MDIHDVTTATGLGRSGAVATTPADAERAKVRSLAEQFESMLLAQMLREMKQAMAPDSDDQGLGGSLIGDTITSELASALGRSHPLGLSALLESAFERNGTEAATATGSPAPADVPAVVAAAAPAAVASPARSAESAPVTSRYGWRTDPLNGQPRFHAGVDLRAAYGQDVRAATDGVVTFAGEKPGYGLVVVVSHGSGLETRYAHLSSTTVTEGTSVDAGTIIARSGTSGRATGPHLHFEVRQDGQAVDPALVAGLVPTVAPPRAAD